MANIEIDTIINSLTLEEKVCQLRVVSITELIYFRFRSLLVKASPKLLAFLTKVSPQLR